MGDDNSGSREQASSAIWVAVSQIELPDKKYFKIGEVAHLVGVEPHVLRYWQTQFPQVRPHKSRSGHRLYRRKDVETLLAIKELLHVQRFTIAGARQALKNAVVHRGDTSVPPIEAAALADGPADPQPAAAPPAVASPPAASAPAAPKAAGQPLASASGATPGSTTATTTRDAALARSTGRDGLADQLVPPSTRLAAPAARKAQPDHEQIELVGLEGDTLRGAMDRELARRSPEVVEVIVVPADGAPTEVPTTAAPLEAQGQEVGDTELADELEADAMETKRTPQGPAPASGARGQDVAGPIAFVGIASGRAALADAKRDLQAVLDLLDIEDDALARRKLGPAFGPVA